MCCAANASNGASPPSSSSSLKSPLGNASATRQALASNGCSQPRKPAPKSAAPTPSHSSLPNPTPKSHNHCAAVLAGPPAWGTEIPAADRRSGYDFMSPETRAMQDDDKSNPGMLWVLDGEAMWNGKDGASNLSCADCHTSASMRGVATHYPTFEVDYKRLVDLGERINICRSKHQNATPFSFESKELLALTAFVTHQSRGA